MRTRTATYRQAPDARGTSDAQLSAMRDTSQEPSTTVTESPPHNPNDVAFHERPSRLVSFAREHPALTVAGVAGAGLIGGIEMAAGVLLGAGVAGLIRGLHGGATDERAMETRGRVRRVVDRTPHDLHELKERGRAMLLAARGKITAPPTEHHDTRPGSPEPGATHEAPV